MLIVNFAPPHNIPSLTWSKPYFFFQEKAEEILEDSPEGQRLRFLENEIHKTNLKLMEGETIKKKYMTILDMLKKERLTFGNQIEGLEAQLRKQEDEIEKLKVISKFDFEFSVYSYKSTK